MGRKSKNKNKLSVQPEEQKKPNHEIYGIVVIAVSMLLSLGIYSDGSAPLLMASKNFLGGLFGSVIYAIPPIVFIYGVLIMFQKVELAIEGRTLSLVLSFILVAAFVHTNNWDFSQENMPLKYDIGNGKKSVDYNTLSDYFYKSGAIKKGGGLFGGMISFMFVSLLGVYGANTILVAGVLILILYLTNVSFVSFIMYIKRALVWISGIIIETIKHIRENSQKVEKPKTIKKSGNLNVNVNGKIFEVNRKNIEKELEEIKNIIPDKVVAAAKEQFEQQEIPHIKINEEPKARKSDNNKTEKVEIDIFASNHDDGNYKMPPMALLNKPVESDKPKSAKKEILDSAKKLEDTLKSFGVDAKVIEINRGPTVTRFELQPSAGVKVSKIVNLADDIALNLAASGIRIEAPIPGKAAVGIEVPNKENTAVFLREILDSDKFRNHPSKVSISLGKDITGEIVVADITKMPHLLIAGATGSGKSVCINTLITSILYKAKPSEVKILMIDPKVVELGVYNGIPHLLIPVVTEPKKAAGALNWAVQEMVQRYKTFAERGVRDIKGYNTLVKEENEKLPQVVIIIDELADLMMVAPNDVEDAICRLAQMARAAGMHLVIATQRPSVDVITGVIKANIPSRISFAVSSQVDSRTILDMAGGEKLLGAGDMLYYPVGESKPIRVQGAYISDKEVEAIVEHIKNQGQAEYSEDIIEKINTEKGIVDDPGDNDELLPQAIEVILEGGQASVSMLQRRLKVGYARAARLIDQMEARGIVGGFEGSKPRQILISKDEFYSGGLGI